MFLAPILSPVSCVPVIKSGRHNFRLRLKSELVIKSQLAITREVAIGSELETKTRMGEMPFAKQFKNNYLTEMCSSSEEGSYLRPIDFCITQL